MEGPTPISALIHAATMVAAGVYLVARVYPIFELSSSAMGIIAWTGAITAFVAATIAITQLDIKKALAYSTCSQLGYMVMAMGAGAYSAGLFHLVTHAYFKALLFLCVGAVIHGLGNQQDMRYMGGLRKYMPAVSYTYLIGTLAISGIFLSGFWSKESIFTVLYEKEYGLLLFSSIIVASMTTFYSFRIYFMTFEGEYRGKCKPHKSSKVLTIPLILLAIPSALLGFLLSGKLEHFGIGSFEKFIEPLSYHVGAHKDLMLPAVSILIAFLGLALAAMFYLDRLRTLLKFNPTKIKKNLAFAYNISVNKWYFDDIYNAFIKTMFLPLSKGISFFDKYIVDGFVNLSAFSTALFGRFLNLFQNGNLQGYITILLCGLLIITVSAIIGWILYTGYGY